MPPSRKSQEIQFTVSTEEAQMILRTVGFMQAHTTYKPLLRKLEDQFNAQTNFSQTTSED